ncbi:hemerythrin domain-containing protein [Allosphingosinicella flava]|uniref:Hemerythrin domain-containing protein n=1 Tax=Allosphingosinicella flava TaxID=2771430 RepID=A0A7T2GKX6_9SPHN|nr:hemerythrin domain-containing protein [Sphingosinicella flava]QPQ55771.1 hemerythrin domain-containing protein [Sphingosinicella flava]
MATRETSRSSSRNNGTTSRSRTVDRGATSANKSNRSSTSENSSNAGTGQRGGSGRSAFSWDNGGRTAVIGAAVAGVAAGFAANFGRKFIVQFATGRSDWFESLRNEHEMTLAIFDKIEATRDDQAMMRGMLTMQLKHALSKHAMEEENVIYPALREANEAADADHLNSDHGYVKTFLYEMDNIPKDSPQWLAKVKEFRTMLEAHIREEEDRIFPEFHSMLSEEQNKKLTAAMHKEGLKLA